MFFTSFSHRMPTRRRSAPFNTSLVGLFSVSSWHGVLPTPQFDPVLKKIWSVDSLSLSLARFSGQATYTLRASSDAWALLDLTWKDRRPKLTDPCVCFFTYVFYTAFPPAAPLSDQFAPRSIVYRPETPPRYLPTHAHLPGKLNKRALSLRVFTNRKTMVFG